MDSESGFISTMSSLDMATAISEEKLCSHGATCDTFKVFRENKYVFVKRLKKEYANIPCYWESFVKEFEIGLKLSSPYIPQYMEYTEEDGIPSITMEYVDGITLRNLLDINPDYFCAKGNTNKFLTQLLEGLQDLHSQQIVHLDLKPENIMLTNVNHDVRIVDLGFCYTPSMPFTQGRTSAFAAPEQLVHGGIVDARTDIYAVGKILEYISQKVNKLPMRSRKIMNRCLKEDKDERYQNVADILYSLQSQRRISLSVISSLAVLAITCCIVFYFHIPRAVHRAIYGYDVVDTVRCWNILSDDSLTCEVAGNKQIQPSRYENYDLAISPELHYEGKVYKVVQIADSAFTARKQFRQLFIANGIRSIGQCAFAKCGNLFHVSFPKSMHNIDNDAFAGCSNLDNIILPDGLTEIKNATFHKTAIHEIIIPEGVTLIGKDAFVDCRNLSKVQLPSTLKTLERGVFFKCPKLCELTIPAGVESLGDYLLMENPNFKCLYNYAVKPQPVYDLFDNPEKVTVYVPRQSVDLYRNAPYWRECNIQPMP